MSEVAKSLFLDDVIPHSKEVRLRWNPGADSTSKYTITRASPLESSSVSSQQNFGCVFYALQSWSNRAVTLLMRRKFSIRGYSTVTSSIFCKLAPMSGIEIPCDCMEFSFNVGSWGSISVVEIWQTSEARRWEGYAFRLVVGALDN